MRYSRLIVTAANERWLNAAISEFCGYGSSVIGCDAEVGLEQRIDSSETLDGRPGASLLVFGFSKDAVESAISNRTGQCLMTSPTSAVFNGLIDDQTAEVPLGKHLRFFGDGYQKSKLIGERRFWRIPVMDGEFIVEDVIGIGKGIAGGNFLILTTDQATGLRAAEQSVDAIARLPNVITPFPGGVVRSGSKVGSRYAALRASTSDPYCPTLRGRVDTALPDNVQCVYEIVIDGTDFDSVALAMTTGIQAAVGQGVVAVSAGNYGGKLGKHHFQLQALLKSDMSV